MALERFSRVQPQDNREDDAPSKREFVEMQVRLERALQRISSCPLLDGRLVEDVEISTGVTTKVAHGLGREWVGWFLVGKSVSGSAVGETTQTDRTKYLDLVGSTQTVSLWVF